MDNETRNNRIQDLTDEVNQADNTPFDIDDLSNISEEDLSASAENIDQIVSAPASRSDRIASSLRSGTSNRVRSIDMSDIDTSSASDTSHSRRSTSVRSSSAVRSSSSRTSTRTSSASRSSSSGRTASSKSASGRTSSQRSTKNTRSGSDSSARSTSSRRVSEARNASRSSDTGRNVKTSAARRTPSQSDQTAESRQVPAVRRQTSPAVSSKKYTDVVEQKKRRPNTLSTNNGSRKPSGKKNTKKKKSGFKKFLIIYSAALLVIIIVTCIILSSFLATYEKNQPTNVAASVVAQFSSSDKLRSFLEKNADLVNQNAAILNYEDSFVSAVDGKKISYIEDPSNTTSEVTTYKITADSMPVASITLVKGDKGAFGLSSWVLSGIDTSAAFSDVKTYSILVPEGSKVTVNGTELSETMITGTGVPEVLQSSAQFIASPPTYTTYDVKVVSDTIDVAGTDSTGAALKFTQTDNSFVAGAEASQEFIDSVKDRVEAGLKSYALYFIYESFDLADYIMDGCELSAFIFGGTFDGEEYDPINPWLYNFEYIDSYSFSQFEASNYVKYSDDCFTVDVKYKLDIVFTDASYSDDNQKLDATWVWVKNGDQWYVSASKTH